jgi:ubiquinone/menaquinone biosynthesis C-methylase UbiE
MENLVVSTTSRQRRNNSKAVNEMNQQDQAEAEFDAYSSAYDAAVNDAIAFSGLKVDYFTRVKADYLTDLITNHFGDARQASILDVGCGVGNFHQLLSDRVGSIAGVDVSKASIDRARERNPGVCYKSYSGERLPFDDKTFDVVFTVCVMHHVPPAQWPLFAAEMKRVLKPGGMVAVFEHNPRNPLTQRIVSNCVFDKNAVLLRSEETRSLLRQAGFTDLIERFIITIPPSGRFLRSVDLLLGRLPFGAQYFIKATA